MTGFLRRRVDAARQTFRDFPRPFWMLMGATFIDAFGSAMLFPFFTLYVTARFGIGMTEVGLIFLILTVASLVGTTIGGGMADRFGRKKMVIFGLIASALTVFSMGLASRIGMFFAAAVFSGLFANAGGPARQAMVADLLPEPKRAQGFGLHRVLHNLAFTIGPAVGGLLAARSYLSLFILDTIASLATAFAVLLLIPETRPEADAAQPQETTSETFRNYGQVLRDSFFMLFLLATTMMVLVYTQMQGTLSVYLRDAHGVQEAAFGYLLSLNAGMVVLFQFAITRRIEGLPPFLVLSLGTLFYVVGFGMYGFVSAYPMFLLAMALITFGEMLTAPTGQAVAASAAPEAMRGRYMAVYGFSWMIPGAVGMYLAGLIMDNYNPAWVWYAAAVTGMLAALMFVALHLKRRSSPKVVPKEIAA